MSARRTGAAWALAAVLAAVLAASAATAATAADPGTAGSADAAIAGARPAATEADIAAAVQRARDAARANHHAQAIRAFGQAMAAAPQRRREWLLELADQHTWAQQLDVAIALYREALQQPDAASHQAARRGLARALSWDGRHGQALAEYALALAQDPHDRDAVLGHARVLGWQGRHRAALERLLAHLQHHPGDREAVQLAADTLAWMGRADRATGLLGSHLRSDPGDRQAAAMLQRLEQAQAPVFSADLRHIDQSDGLGIAELSTAWRHTLGQGRGELAARYSQARYTPAADQAAGIRVQRPGLEARWRFSDTWAWHGMLALDVIDNPGTARDHRRLSHDSSLTWWPGDRWRLDLSSARWTFDSEAALRAGLTARQHQVAFEHRPDDLTRLSLRLAGTGYSDGNHRRSLQVEGERRLARQPQLDLGLRHAAQHFSQPGQDGYYNPAWVRTSEISLSSKGWIAGRWHWALHAATGRETERGAPSKPVHAGRASLLWLGPQGLALEVALDHSTSRTTASGGFRRSTARLTLHQRH